MKRLTLTGWFVLGASVVSSTSAGEAWKFDPKFEPAMIDSNATSDKALAARFSLSAERKIYRDSFDGLMNAVVKGTLMRRANDNPENLTAEVEGIGRWLFAQDLGAPPSPGSPPPSSSPGLSLPDRYLQLHATVRFESDQALDNTQLAIGPRVSFVTLQNTGWWWIIPSIHLGYHRVEVFESEQLRKLGEPERSFYRFDAYGSWKWKPFATATQIALRNIGLHADLRYYRAFELPTKAERASLDDSFYRAFDLSYALPKSKHLREVYLRLARGRLPAAKSDARTISIGVVLVP
jgi:hypothetical protein